FVTAVVQFIQNTIKLRAKNLSVGVHALLEKFFTELRSDAQPGQQGGDPAHPSLLTSQKAREVAKEVMERAPFAPKENANWFTKLMSPTVSWLSKDELIEYVKKS